MVDPCNLETTLELAQFGCAPAQSSQCLDFEGTGSGGLPTGWFRYYDKIAQAPMYWSYDVNQGGWHWQSYGPGGSGDAVADDSYTRLSADDSHCGSGNVAYHLLARNQDIWGPQFGVKFENNDMHLPPFDVSAWEGIGFWLRKGSDHPEVPNPGTVLFVSLADQHTVGSTTNTECNESANVDAEKCDPYGVAVGLEDQWRYVRVPFAKMQQRGYGVHVPYLDLTQISQIKFAMDIGDAANGNWNIWLDDVSLYRYKP